MNKYSNIDGLADFPEIERALKELETETERLNTPQHGEYPEMTAENTKKLLEMCQKLGVLCDKYLNTEDENKTEEITNIVTRVRDMVREDSEALLEYNPEQGILSLPSVLNMAHVHTFNIGDDDIKTVGANMSSRIPFSYTDVNGITYSGVFTQKKVINPEKDFWHVYEAMENDYPGMGNIFRKLYDAFCEEIAVKIRTDALDLEFKDKALYMLSFVSDAMSKYKNAASVLRRIHELHIPEARNLDIDTPGFIEAFNFWRIGMEAVKKTHGINVNNSYIQGESRIDSRNTAMSRVAAMLGVPQLLAHAQPMNIVYKGKTYEGTFMEAGKGLDIFHPTPESLAYTADMFKGEGLKSVADIQILDFICGNTDRHLGNMLYRFDTSDPDPKKHKFLGVQGIDNDCCFGEFVPQDPQEGRAYINSLYSLKVISKSMADAVEAMDIDVLKFQLRDAGLTEKQVNAAGERLQLIKNAVAEGKNYYSGAEAQRKIKKNPAYAKIGKLRILSDENFKNMNLQNLKAEGAYNGRAVHNQFAIMTQVPEAMKREAVGTDGLHMKKVNEDFGEFLHENEYGDVTNKLKAMKDATTGRGTSPEFENLGRWLTLYQAFVKRIGTSRMTDVEINARGYIMQNIKKAATKYLEHKTRDKGFTTDSVEAAAEKANSVFHKSYASNRIQLVTVIGQWAEKELNTWGPEDKTRKALKELIEKRKTDKEARDSRLDAINERDTREIEKMNARLKKEALEIQKKQTQMHI